MPALENKVVIVTGASQGAGRAIALMLAREGAKIVAVARNKQELEALAAEISAREGACAPVAADVTKVADTRRVAQQALDQAASARTRKGKQAAS